MNERMKINPAEAAAAGAADARKLLDDLNELFADPDGVCSSGLLIHALTETIALAAENRIEECSARLEAFAKVIGPLLYRAPADEQRAIDAAIATCSQVSAGRIVAAHPEDDDATVTLAELQLAVRALEPNFTETEGGEL